MGNGKQWRFNLCQQSKTTIKCVQLKAQNKKREVCTHTHQLLPTAKNHEPALCRGKQTNATTMAEFDKFYLNVVSILTGTHCISVRALFVDACMCQTCGDTTKHEIPRLTVTSLWVVPVWTVSRIYTLDITVCSMSQITICFVQYIRPRIRIRVGGFTIKWYTSNDWHHLYSPMLCSDVTNVGSAHESD